MFPIASLAFVGGLMTGSFVGLVAHRVPRGTSIVGGRSVCDSCGAQIAAYDNVPVLSWLVLRGRCRSCRARIPLRYLLVELALGAAFAATAVVGEDFKQIHLSDYRGRYIVLFFYPLDFTFVCPTEIIAFSDRIKDFHDRNCEVIGVSVDSVDSHKKFCAKEGLNFRLLADSDGKVSQAYGSLTNLGVVKFSARHTFLIDPTGKIAKAYTNVDPAHHSEEVLAALDELQKR